MLGALPNVFQNTSELLQFFRGEEKMKRLSLIVFLVCLMTSGAFAATKDWVGDPNAAGAGEWSANANYWSPAGIPADTGSTSDYVKNQKGTVGDANVCTLNSAAGNFPKNKVTMAASDTTKTATLKIIGGSIGIGNEFQVGDNGGKKGAVIQTDGSVTTFQGQTAGKLEIGYKLNGVGTWTISGGSIGFSGSTNVGQIIVGGAGAAGAIGTFTVHSSAPVINTDNFLVGTKNAAGEYPGTGTVKFELTDGVSPINVQSAIIIDPLGDAACVANLVIALLDEDVPAGPIVLFKNSSATAVSGTFDTVSGDQSPWDRALEGDTVVLTTPGNASYTYTLTYLYNADAGAIGNDIALVPEPATIALLGLGSLIAIRRRKK
jgi:hypothetical protein